MRFRFLIPILLLLALFPRAALAWGDKGHEIVNRLAVEGMPAETPRFFRAAVERLTYLGPEPDRWKSRAREGGSDTRMLDRATFSEHFLDLEFVTGFTLPPDRYEYLRALLANGVVTGQVKLESPGFLPYTIAEMAQNLKRQWELWRAAPTKTRAERERKRQIEENILYVAGTMGHYVGDGGNPHHTTWHYNGWVEAREPNPEGFTTERGIHQRMEIDFVDAAVEAGDVRPLVPALRPVENVFEESLRYLRTSHALVRDLYRLDKRNAFHARPENAAVNAEGKQFVTTRLAAAAAMLRDIWAAAMKGGS